MRCSPLSCIDVMLVEWAYASGVFDSKDAERLNAEFLLSPKCHLA